MYSAEDVSLGQQRLVIMHFCSPGCLTNPAPKKAAQDSW
jgi:hypothetical protein